MCKIDKKIGLTTKMLDWHKVCMINKMARCVQIVQDCHNTSRIDIKGKGLTVMQDLLKE